MFKSFEELSDWICPMGRWSVLARLRVVRGWHNKEMNGGVDSPFSCWVCSWFLFLLLSRESCGCSVAGRDRGAAAGGLWVGPDPQRGLALCLFLGEDGEQELGHSSPTAAYLQQLKTWPG